MVLPLTVLQYLILSPLVFLGAPSAPLGVSSHVWAQSGLKPNEYRKVFYFFIFYPTPPHLFVAIFQKLLSFVRLHMLGVDQVLVGGTGVPGATP